MPPRISELLCLLSIPLHPSLYHSLSLWCSFFFISTASLTRVQYEYVSVCVVQYVSVRVVQYVSVRVVQYVSVCVVQYVSVRVVQYVSVCVVS